MDAIAACNLKKKMLKDFNTLIHNLNKGYLKEYLLLLLEVCVIENYNHFTDDVYKYLMTVIYE